MKRVIIAFLFFALGLSSAFAQSGAPVKQSGNITPNTVPWWVTSGVIGGGITAVDSPISSFGTTGPLCSNSARQASGGWNSICLKANTNGPATISLQNYGTAPAQSMQFVVNGIVITSLPSQTIDGTLTINPPAGTLSQGIVINQTGPTSGSVVGPTNLNFINSVYRSTTTGTGGPFADRGVWQSETSAFRVNFTVGGPNLDGEALVGILGHIIYDGGSTAGVDKVGIGGAAYSNAADPGGACLCSGATAVVVDSGGNMGRITGFEFDLGIIGSGISAQRFGIFVVNQGTSNATSVTEDAVMGVASGNIGGSFKKWFLLSNAGVAPLTTNADFFYADAAYTVANIFNLPTMTVSGNILGFQNAVLTGPGVLKMGSVSSGLFSTTPGYVIQASIAAGGNASLVAQSNSTTGFNGLDVSTSTTASGISAIVYEASNTSTRFGQTLGNWAFVGTAASPQGLLIGTGTNTPVIFGTNNTQAAKLTTTGFLQMGNGTFSGSAGNLVQASLASGGNVSLVSNANSTSGIDGITAGTSDQLNAVALLAAEASNTTTRFGQTLGNWAELVAFGPSSNGLLIGSLTATPVLFGINNAEVGRFSSIGNLDLLVGGSITNNQNNPTLWSISNNSAGTVALATFVAQNGTGSGSFGIGGTGYTFNTLFQNRGYANANATTAGLLLSAEGSGATHPIIFVLNDLEVGRWDGATPGLLNAAVAFSVGGTAGQAAKTCGATIVVKGGIITSC